MSIKYKIIYHVGGSDETYPEPDYPEPDYPEPD